MFTVFVMLVVHTKLQLYWQLYMSYKHDMLPVVSKRKGCDFLHLSSDANSPTFGGRLALFCLVSRSPVLVHKSPTFYVRYKILNT